MAYRIHYSDYVAPVPTPPPPSGESVPGGPSFIGNPQPPDVPCDPTGDGWRGPEGPQGVQGDQGDQGPPGTTTVVGGLPEAPTDGTIYGRQGSSASWLGALRLTMNGVTPTGYGTGVGQLPVFANYQGSGFANLAFPTRFVISKSGGTTANDFASVNIIRTTTHSGGAGGLVATGLRVNTIAGQGVTNQEWAVLGVAQSSSTVPGGAIVGGDFQGIRLANSQTPIWGGIFNAVDQCGTSSSVTPGAVLGGEVDIRSSGADDGSNGGMFGGKGLRVCLQTVIHRQDTTVPLEVSHGHWFSTDELTTNKLYSAVGFVVGMQVHQALDTRGAVSPDANPHAAVRLLHDQIIDFNGGPALNSAPGAYLQYRSGKLYYVVAGVDKWSVDASGNMRCAGTVTPSVTP